MNMQMFHNGLFYCIISVLILTNLLGCNQIYQSLFTSINLTATLCQPLLLPILLAAN